MEKTKVVHVGVYKEDDPFTMKWEFFIQTLKGDTILCGGFAESPREYVSLGSSSIKKLETLGGLESVVIHPGKTNDPHNDSLPITDPQILKYIAKGMANIGSYQVRVDYEEIELPNRGAKQEAL